MECCGEKRDPFACLRNPPHELIKTSRLGQQQAAGVMGAISSISAASVAVGSLGHPSGPREQKLQRAAKEGSLRGSSSAPASLCGLGRKL
eukprot:scaffold138863_cov22-Tisochrysis_lutea.AAC.1